MDIKQILMCVFTSEAGRVVANIPFGWMLLLGCGPGPMHPAAWVQPCARRVAGTCSAWGKKKKSIFWEAHFSVLQNGFPGARLGQEHQHLLVQGLVRQTA